MYSIDTVMINDSTSIKIFFYLAVSEKKVLEIAAGSQEVKEQ